MKDIAYHRPASLEEALALKQELGTAARFVAGATDVMVMTRQGRLSCQALISLRRLDELRGIQAEDGRLVIGAGATLREILDSRRVHELAPVLHDAVGVMGSRQMRNLATIGGNVMTAVSSGDTLPPMLVLEAQCRLLGPEGARDVPMDRMLTGPRTTAARPDEVLGALIIPLPRAGDPPTAGAFQKIMRRAALDLAVASLAVQFTLSADGRALAKARVAAGALGPTPLRISEAEQMLAGQEPSAELLARAAQAVQNGITPWDDVRGSAWYRHQVSGVIFKRAAALALKRLGLDMEEA
jgi:CO/xanthine dehydrogenase FAD-binding subunit